METSSVYQQQQLQSAVFLATLKTIKTYLRNTISELCLSTSIIFRCTGETIIKYKLTKKNNKYFCYRKGLIIIKLKDYYQFTES